MMSDIDALPKPNDAFVWVQADDAPILVCRPLAAFTAHLFTTQHWPLGSNALDPDDDTPWAAVARAVGVDASQLIRARQVHGSHAISGPSQGSERPSADIIVTADQDQAAAVQSADCVPVLIVDRRRGAVAAAHAGWRGLAAYVPNAAVAALRREHGSAPGDLYAAIGPAIGSCCYQVGPDVLQAFVHGGFGAERLAKYFLPVPTHSDNNPSLLAREPRVDRWFFDTWRAAREELEDAGVPAGQIYTAELCTASHPGVFCSYRRDGQRAGRMAAAIRSSQLHP
jgi:YfiH family protein